MNWRTIAKSLRGTKHYNFNTLQKSVTERREKNRKEQDHREKRKLIICFVLIIVAIVVLIFSGLYYKDKYKPTLQQENIMDDVKEALREPF